MDAELSKIAARGRVLLWSTIAFLAIEGVLVRYLLPFEVYESFACQLAGSHAAQAQRFASQVPLTEIAHRSLGVLLLASGMLQFDPALRRRRPRLHRLSGYAFASLLLVTVVAAAVLAVWYPFAGIQETVLMLAIAGGFVFMLSKAVLQARARRFMQHREWMIRVFALSFLIAAQRFLLPADDPSHRLAAAGCVPDRLDAGAGHRLHRRGVVDSSFASGWHARGAIGAADQVAVRAADATPGGFSRRCRQSRAGARLRTPIRRRHSTG